MFPCQCTHVSYAGGKKCNLHIAPLMFLSVLQLGLAEGVIFSDHGTELGSGPTVPAR